MLVAAVVRRSQYSNEMFICSPVHFLVQNNYGVGHSGWERYAYWLFTQFKEATSPSFVIRVNLLHPSPSLFLLGLLLPLLMFFYLIKLIFFGFLQVEGNFVRRQKKKEKKTDSKCCDELFKACCKDNLEGVWKLTLLAWHSVFAQYSLHWYNWWLVFGYFTFRYYYFILSIKLLLIYYFLFTIAAAGISKQPVSPADLDYVEEQALLETQREVVGSLGTIPF